jgi:hypothetical protein
LKAIAAPRHAGDERVAPPPSLGSPPRRKDASDDGKQREELDVGGVAEGARRRRRERAEHRRRRADPERCHALPEAEQEGEGGEGVELRAPVDRPGRGACGGEDQRVDGEHGGRLLVEAVAIGTSPSTPAPGQMGVPPRHAEGRSANATQQCLRAAAEGGERRAPSARALSATAPSEGIMPGAS